MLNSILSSFKVSYRFKNQHIFYIKENKDLSFLVFTINNLYVTEFHIILKKYIDSDWLLTTILTLMKWFLERTS